MDDEQERSANRRVVVIGLDGGTFAILDPLMAAGKLPNFSRLVASGARGELRTVIPPITPAAWTTFMTGLNPGKHGVLEFIVRDEQGGESPVNSRLRRGKSIFRIVSDSGRKVVSLSIPITYPPEEIDGLMVSDFMTPKGVADYGRPRELLEDLERELGPYRLHISEVYSPNRILEFFEDVEADVRYKLGAARYMAGKIDWSLLAVHIHGADRLQHELWHLIDSAHPMHNQRESDIYESRFYKFYEKLDLELGRFLETLRDDDSIFVISDHGFGPVYRFMNFNVWLMDRGYLKLHGGPRVAFKKALFGLGVTPKNAYRLLMRLGLAKLRETIGMTARAKFFDVAGLITLSLRDVDWSKTIAYSKGYYGQIFINLKGREPNGIVAEDDYENVRGKIVDDLRAISDPETGKPIIGEIYRPEEIYDGPYAKYAPDITFLPSDMSFKAIGMTDFSSNRFIEPVYANSGDHRMDGILIANGPSIKRGAVAQGAWIGDMAPTILYTLGVAVPKNMDGKILKSIFTDDFLAHHPVIYSESSVDEGRGESGYSESEKEDVRKRLKDMGYL